MNDHNETVMDETELLRELLDLRRAVASVLGRDQYVFGLLDRAIESGHAPAQRRARKEFATLPVDLQELVSGQL